MFEPATRLPGRDGMFAERYLSLPSEPIPASWYVAYTTAKHEKCVASKLEQREVQHFLPLYESVHRWKDRRAMVQIPLFPGYVFVRLALRDRMQVLQVPGVVRLVGFNGEACAVPDSEIEAIKICLNQKISVKPHPYVDVGRHVRIVSGPLAGLEGIVIEKKNRLHFIVSLGLIHGSASVKVGAANIEAV